MFPVSSSHPSGPNTPSYPSPDIALPPSPVMSFHLNDPVDHDVSEQKAKEDESRSPSFKEFSLRGATNMRELVLPPSGNAMNDEMHDDEEEQHDHQPSSEESTGPSKEKLQELESGVVKKETIEEILQVTTALLSSHHVIPSTRTSLNHLWFTRATTVNDGKAWFSFTQNSLDGKEEEKSKTIACSKLRQEGGGGFISSTDVMFYPKDPSSLTVGPQRAWIICKVLNHPDEFIASTDMNNSTLTKVEGITHPKVVPSSLVRLVAIKMVHIDMTADETENIKAIHAAFRAENNESELLVPAFHNNWSQCFQHVAVLKEMGKEGKKFAIALGSNASEYLGGNLNIHATEGSKKLINALVTPAKITELSKNIILGVLSNRLCDPESFAMNLSILPDNFYERQTTDEMLSQKESVWMDTKSWMEKRDKALKAFVTDVQEAVSSLHKSKTSHTQKLKMAQLLITLSQATKETCEYSEFTKDAEIKKNIAVADNIIGSLKAFRDKLNSDKNSKDEEVKQKNRVILEKSKKEGNEANSTIRQLNLNVPQPSSSSSSSSSKTSPSQFQDSDSSDSSSDHSPKKPSSQPSSAAVVSQSRNKSVEADTSLQTPSKKPNPYTQINAPEKSKVKSAPATSIVSVPMVIDADDAQDTAPAPRLVSTSSSPRGTEEHKSLSLSKLKFPALSPHCIPALNEFYTLYSKMRNTRDSILKCDFGRKNVSLDHQTEHENAKALLFALRLPENKELFRDIKSLYQGSVTRNQASQKSISPVVLCFGLVVNRLFEEDHEFFVAASKPKTDSDVVMQDSHASVKKSSLEESKSKGMKRKTDTEDPKAERKEGKEKEKEKEKGSSNKKRRTTSGSSSSRRSSSSKDSEGTDSDSDSSESDRRSRRRRSSDKKHKHKKSNKSRSRSRSGSDSDSS